MIRTQDTFLDLGCVSSDLLDSWLEKSRAGDVISRDKMLVWVHRTGLAYFRSRVPVEALFSEADAWDMASESVVEFERSWKRVRQLAHYCRRMFKNNLYRFLNKKRRLLYREQELDIEYLERAHGRATSVLPTFDFERLSDHDRDRLDTARSELERADKFVRYLFEYRVFSGHLTYAEIGEQLGTSETSLRMRMTRFNRRVKNRHEQLTIMRGAVDRRPPVARMEPRRL